MSVFFRLMESERKNRLAADYLVSRIFYSFCISLQSLSSNKYLFQRYFLSLGCILPANKSEFARSANAAALGAVNMPEVNASVIHYIGPSYFLGN